MIDVAIWITLVGLCVPLYTYLAYPLLLFVLASLIQSGRDAWFLVSRKDRRSRSRTLHTASLIISAYNEEPVIERTIQNCLALDYPKDRLEIIIGSDASTDRTVEIAGKYQDRGVRVLAFEQRRGKTAVITDCAARARGRILLFCDANTLLRPDAVTKLVRHFDDPHVGAVCGELQITAPDGAMRDEGLYWRFEVVLKLLESRLDSVLGANGAIYAVRKELFPALPPHLITDDFVIVMKVRSRGFRALYDPEALALEEAPAAASHEFARRVRIGAGNWQALWHCWDLLLPWKGFVAFAFWSHKVARWLTPFALPAALAANAFLLAYPLWRAVFAVHAALYILAGLAWSLRRVGLPAGPLRLVQYFVLINAAIGLGILKGALGLQNAAWRRTVRGTAQPPGDSP